MEFKEEVKKDLNKYFEKFEKYDNELIPEIENKISENKVKFEEFEQKWSGEMATFSLFNQSSWEGRSGVL